MIPGFMARDLVLSLRDLPSPPEVYSRLTATLEQPAWKVRDLADVIGASPSVTARTLRLANSPFYGMVREVGTLEEAINVLGTEELRALVLATTVMESFRGLPPDLVSLRDFLRSGVRCAVTAGILAARSDPSMVRGRLFVSALLHDVGSMVVCLLLPEAAREALLHRPTDDREDFSIERAVMKGEEAVVGAELLRYWRLPEVVVTAVRWQSAPERATRYRKEVTLVHFARRFAAVLRQGVSDLTALVPAESAEWGLIGLLPQELAGFPAEVQAGYAETMAMFGG